MPYFKKIVVFQEGHQWNGENLGLIQKFCPDAYLAPIDGAMVLAIPTLEGVMSANIGDWIMKGTHGEFYPVKENIHPDIFLPATGDEWHNWQLNNQKEV